MLLGNMCTQNISTLFVYVLRGSATRQAAHIKFTVTTMEKEYDTVETCFLCGNSLTLTHVGHFYGLPAFSSSGK
jgi:hypothetical protein